MVKSKKSSLSRQFFARPQDCFIPVSKMKRVCVVVLGDFGRSPRMQYHSLSLSKKKYAVDVLAYKGTQPSQEILSRDNINIHYLKDVPVFLTNWPKIVQYILKTIWQAMYLLSALFTLPKMDYLLLQNPPSIPTLPVCWFTCYLRKSKMFVDFHNYGFTIMGLTSGKNSLIVQLAKKAEKHLGRKAHMSICVTKAMQADLKKNWDIESHVFYDCAPDIFQKLIPKEKHAFFNKMAKEYKEFQPKNLRNGEDRNIFTRRTERVEFCSNRPALLVSGTSWTEDEDFSILLDALEDYEEACQQKDLHLPHLLVCITGKGPLKSYYEEKIAEKSFSFVTILTLWLKFEDYPKLLGVADLGICLHKSSSGLDLPMKVVDMFGCCLPVCAVKFRCIGELIKDGENGTVFSSSDELSQQLQFLLNGFPDNKHLRMLRRNLEQPRKSWDENWNRVVWPLLSNRT